MIVMDAIPHAPGTHKPLVDALAADGRAKRLPPGARLRKSPRKRPGRSRDRPGLRHAARPWPARLRALRPV